ncbi:phage virion morphogenesis protein [Pseudomonas quasicaspiana]|nr:phage virion morphogenesis protein [Pseudomonas quasicaspiana]
MATLGKNWRTSRSAPLPNLEQQLRCSQQQRIASQHKPDGTPFVPRKQRDPRAKQGRIGRGARLSSGYKRIQERSYIFAHW